MEYGATTLNLASIIEHHARLAPEREAIVWNDMRFTYGQLNALSNRVANALTEMNVGRGDKVALSCPNLPFFPIVYYGILKAGAAVVPSAAGAGAADEQGRPASGSRAWKSARRPRAHRPLVPAARVPASPAA